MNIYEVKNGHRIMPRNEGISYKIRSGAAFISLLLAYEDGRMLNRRTIGTAGEGVIVPGYAEEKLYNDQKLIAHLLIEPKNFLVIEELPFEEAHKSEFLDNMGYEGEDYENRISKSDMYDYLIHDYFFLEELKSEQIEKNIERHKANCKSQEEIIVSAYNLSRRRNPDADILEDDILYQGVEFLAKKMDLTLAPIDKIKRASKDKVTLQGIARCSGFLCREVELEPKFYKEEISPLICFTKDDGRPIAIYRNIFGRKYCYDPANREVRKLTARYAENISKKAYCIHRPLNDDRLDIRALIKFGMKEFHIGDMLVTLLAMFLVARVGIEVSNLHAALYDSIIPQGSVNNLVNYGMILLGCTIGSLFFSIAQNIAAFRQDNRIKYSLQAAIYNRVFHMPEKFYRNHESGELAYRAGTAASSYYTVYSTVTTILLYLLFAAIYFGKMLKYSDEFAKAGMFFAVAGIGLTILINQLYIKYRRRQSNIMGKIKSYLYQTFSGIDTIRAMGAEDAALYEYMDRASEWSITDFKYGVGDRISEVVSIAVTCLATIVIYDEMVNGNAVISTGVFIGFTSIYTCFTQAMTTIARQIAELYSMLPMLKNSMEILQTAPEKSNDGEILDSLNGDIKVSNVSFSYEPGKPVLKNINLHVKEGEYVAIVGRTGCGKSTLLKLLLGFETPTYGQIMYDDKGLAWMSKPELRRFFGVVLQDDGLFMGSIYKNIVMANPDYTEEDVIKVLNEVGLIEDIKAMPLGIMTPVSEDAHTISGGQMQRILLARALIGNPRILFLDEAMSSIDNIGQRIISESVRKRKITRVVIAHRLSTIVNADRIIVLDNGSIVEEGTYEELMNKKGSFSELVENQTLGNVS
ncbi:MAG: ATP-binding cassette domain-containing protein [Lachnospiraceae bacterium]|nr:ATP-binding cassette domain-containing protein [Lachnospiraceae bacterium]